MDIIFEDDKAYVKVEDVLDYIETHPPEALEFELEMYRND